MLDTQVGYVSDVRFRVLGEVGVVVDDTELALGGPKQRLVLALLLADANNSVSSGRLIDDVWGADPPASARNTLQTYVSQLRKTLGPERIETSAAGYRLVVGTEDEVDARQLAEAVETVDLDRLDQLLAAWTGSPFADLADEPALAGEIVRIEDLRATAHEVAIDAALASGRHDQVIGKLISLTERYPFRERFWAQLMLAQYRSARQADALRTYERARRTLVEHLGVEAGPELRHLYTRVLAHDESLDLPAGAAAQPVARQTSEGQRRSRARIVAGAVVLAMIAAAGVGLALLTQDADTDRDSTGVIVVPKTVSVVMVDPATGKVTATIEAAQVKAPVESIFDGTDFWVLNLEPLSFVQIDGRSGEVLRQIASPVDDVGYFTVDGDDLWVTSYTQPTVVQVDIDRGVEVARLGLPGVGGSAGVVLADRSLWVARRDTGTLVRLDPDGQRPVREFPLQRSEAVAAADGSVWVAGPSGDVNRIVTRSDEVVTGRSGAESYYVAAGGGYGWVTDEFAGVVHQIDEAGRVVATYPTDPGARSVSYESGVVWVGNQDAGTVTGISVDDGRQSTLVFDRQVQTVAAGNDRVLVVLADPLPVALSGEMIQLFIPAYQLEPLDPVSLNTPTGRQVLSATCGGLVRLDGDGAARSDLAIGSPEISADGLTYRFTLRQGLRFSPPSNELIDADTFKTTIERALAPRLADDSPGVVALRDPVGTSAYRSGITSDVSGITAEGLDLTITLTEPSDDLLQRLADPAFCAVPARTSADTGVAVPTGNAAPEQALASAGPYYIAQRVNGEYAILLANPNYQGPRAPLLDGLALREGISYESAVASLENGHGDGLTGLTVGQVTQADQFGERVACVSPLPHRGLEPPRVDLAALCRSD
jgi:DNA-binding SARP family transcriptional activator